MSALRRLAACLVLLALTCTSALLYAQRHPRVHAAVDTARLHRYSGELRRRWDSAQTTAYYALLDGRDRAQATLNADPNLRLVQFPTAGAPVYYRLHNLNAARTISTRRVWPPPWGNAGYHLDGSGTPFNELAIWDGGKVRETHVALAGKVLNGDASTSVHFHATHVAGTVVGRNDSLPMAGMSYEGNLTYYDQSQNLSELSAAAASGLLVSNHSYGIAAGWEFSPQAGDTIDWYWFGTTPVDTYEDYRFGFYIDHTAIIDSILYWAPATTMVVSAGNDRGDDGPEPGESHYVIDPVTKKWVVSSVPRMQPDGGGDGYDSLNPYACAKNVITVGAIGDLPGGWSGPGDVTPESYSSFGPTDDGRIKPDIMANGDEVWSAWSYTDTSYINSSGTSMAAPSVTGSINLLLRLWQQTHGLWWPPLASTMKAIVLHTADDGGPHPGPDYQTGWGLMNTLHACDHIQADAHEPHRVIEDYLLEGTVREYFFHVFHPGERVRVTCVWTDAAGVPHAPAVDPSGSQLVFDIDVRVYGLSGGGPPHEPWTMDIYNPDMPANRGDNSVDNVEVVDIDAADGGWYMITVAAKEGTVGANEPAFSLCCTHTMQVDPPVGIDHAGSSHHPSAARLEVFPNPANPAVTIRYDVPTDGPARVVVFDVRGRHVRTLLSSNREAGSYTVRWDGVADSGARVASGVYFVRLESRAGTVTEKVVLSY
jgi:hypothetical protein